MRLIDADTENEKLIDFIEEHDSEIQCAFEYRDRAMLEDIFSKYFESRWIPCSERMPEEKPSIFAKYKGTSGWNKAMWEKGSDNVLVTKEYENGDRMVSSAGTHDGQWHIKLSFMKYKIIAWMPFPKPYGGNEQ